MKHYVLRSFGAIATIVIAAFAGSQQPSAPAIQLTPQTEALSHAKQIALSALIYMADYDDVIPYVNGTDQFRKVTKPYRRNDSIWQDANPNGGQFRFAMNLAGVTSAAIPDPANTPLIYESAAWPDGRRVVAFADGHAKKVSKEDWTQIEPYLHKHYPRTAKKPIKGR